jgi:hypothetical protein
MHFPSKKVISPSMSCLKTSTSLSACFLSDGVADRKLDREQIMQFATCAYIAEKHNLIIRAARLVCCADLEAVGEKPWERFNAPKSAIECYYRGIAAALDLPGYQMFQELSSLLGEVFE